MRRAEKCDDGRGEESLCARIVFPGDVGSHYAERTEVHETRRKCVRDIGKCAVRGFDTYVEPVSTALSTEDLEAAVDFADLNLRA